MENEDKLNEIKRLTEQLTKLLSESELLTSNINNNKNNTQNNQLDYPNINETTDELIGRLEKINVEASHVRKIIKRCDEMYGRTENFRSSTPLYEEFTNITKK